ARRHSVTVKWRRTEAPNHRAIVHDGYVLASDLFSEFPCQIRGVTIDGVAVHRVEDVVDEATRHHWIEDDRNLLSCDFAGTDATQRALGSLATHSFGRFKLLKSAGSRVPIIALHGGAVCLRDRNRGNRAVRPAILSDESQRVGEDFIASGGIE